MYSTYRNRGFPLASSDYIPGLAVREHSCSKADEPCQLRTGSVWFSGDRLLPFQNSGASLLILALEIMEECSDMAARLSPPSDSWLVVLCIAFRESV